MRWGINIPNLRTFLAESRSLNEHGTKFERKMVMVCYGYGLFSPFQIKQDCHLEVPFNFTREDDIFMIIKYTQQMHFVWIYLPQLEVLAGPQLDVCWHMYLQPYAWSKHFLLTLRFWHKQRISSLELCTCLSHQMWVKSD